MKGLQAYSSRFDRGLQFGLHKRSDLG